MKVRILLSFWNCIDRMPFTFLRLMLGTFFAPSLHSTLHHVLTTALLSFASSLTSFLPSPFFVHIFLLPFPPTYDVTS